MAATSIPASTTLSFGATLGNTLGAFQIGVALSLVLFGIISLQVYYYFEHYENDVIHIKAMVSFGKLQGPTQAYQLISKGERRLVSSNAGFA